MIFGLLYFHQVSLDAKLIQENLQISKGFALQGSQFLEALRIIYLGIRKHSCSEYCYPEISLKEFFKNLIKHKLPQSLEESRDILFQLPYSLEGKTLFESKRVEILASRN